MTLLCLSLSAASCTAGREGEVQAPTAATPASDNVARATPAASPAAQQQQPVSAAADEARLKSGGAGEAVVRLDITDGFHVNANPASDKFYIPTELTVAAQEGVAPGKPAYPKAVTKQFKFADKPLAVYEGRAEIRLPLRAEASAAKGPHTLRARLRVQPCNDEACLPPRNLDVSIPVVVE
jgi:DsbC/DsbD-like thiol-disulfide interchange protein